MAKSLKTYDLFIIGGGSGGVRAARWASALGAKVGLAESRELGGTCVVRGCIPKKLLVYASEFSSSFSLAQSYGYKTRDLQAKDLSWDTLRDNIQAEVKRLSGLYKKVLDSNHVDFFPHHASFEDSNHIRVGEQIIKAKYVLIAVGGKPRRPDFPGAEHALFSDDLFTLPELPKKITLIGGGYIGVEFASIFAGLGVQTELLIRAAHILKDFDRECVVELEQAFRERGIKVDRCEELKEIRKLSDESYLLCSKDGSERESSRPVLAVGRVPALEKLGLENIGVEVGISGRVKVDEKFQSNCPGVYAVGDCVGKMDLTPVALEQAMCVVETIFSKDSSRKINYQAIPTAIFSSPPMATVGPSEQALKTKEGCYQVFESRFTPLKHALAPGPHKTYLKLIVEKSSQKVIACHMFGDDSPEIMQMVATAIQGQLTKQIFDQTLGIHPSSAEELTTLRECAREIGQG